jgi:hypothetical protein
MAKFSLTRSQRKSLSKPGTQLKLDEISRIALSAKEVKKYKKLVEAKLDAMGVSGSPVMVKTNKMKTVRYVENGEVKKARVPLNRLSNFKANLVKKLMKLSVSEVERFLAQQFDPVPVVTSEVQIKGNGSATPA